MALWNPTSSACWNRFRTAVSRSAGLEAKREYLRVVEVQDGKRGGSRPGGLHVHALVWSPSPLSICRPFCAPGCGCVRALAIAAGFGHSVDLAPIQPGSKAEAYYVTKYVLKAADARAEVPWQGVRVDRSTGEISEGLVPATYRTWTQSQDWGVTMRQIRGDLAAIAARIHAEQDLEISELLGAVLGAVEVAPEPAGHSPP